MDYEGAAAMGNREPRLSNLVKSLLVLIMTVAASLSVTTHIAQIGGMSFSVCANHR